MTVAPIGTGPATRVAISEPTATVAGTASSNSSASSVGPSRIMVSAAATASGQPYSPIAIRTASAAAIATASIRGDHLGANSRAAALSVFTSRP